MKPPQPPALSDAQIIQRTNARTKAVVSRRLKQLKRLHAEMREVIAKLAEAGVEVEVQALHIGIKSDVDEKKPTESEREVCSAAGVALRRCAKARREARAARAKKS